ncbi:MAG: lipopolysaccharide biosynthesis protein [Halioglobus sp.]|nr:lipopolysaccharide biosynthesis protein [Halioglobus sp.]
MRKTGADPFQTEHLANGLKSRAVKSMGITVSAQVFKLVLQIISITTLARLLNPTDFGLVAMVTVFTGLIQSLVDGGLSMATIQRKDITHQQVSNLFWINAALGLLLALFSVLIAPAIAALYGEPQLTGIVIALSVTFLMSGISVQHDALLRRQMRFKAIAVIDILSVSGGIGAGIAAAVYGLGYWALVVLSVATAAIQMCSRWLALSWRPSFISRGTGIRPLVAFGLNLTGADFVGYFVSNATPFFVGYIGGAQVAGIFNRAQTLTSMPSRQLMPPVIKVLQPTLSRVADDPIKLRRVITGSVRKIALVTMFFTINMVVMADWIVAVVLGSGWGETVQVFQFLSVFTFVTPITTFTAVTLIAAGAARALLYWRFITLGILLTSLLVGMLWGVSGVIAAFALSGLFVRVPLFLYYSSRHLPVTFKEYVAGLLPILIVATVTATSLVVVRTILEIGNPLLGLAICGFVSACIYLALSLSMRVLRAEIFEIKSLLDPIWRRV